MRIRESRRRPFFGLAWFAGSCFFGPGFRFGYFLSAMIVSWLVAE
jgi:hypothetical protein